MTWPANKILRVLHALGIAATAQQIAEETGYTAGQVWDACETLFGRGLATRPQRGVYIITAAGIAAIASGKEIKGGPQGPTGPKARSGTFRERLWKALRHQRKGTIGDFLSLILREGEDETKAAENAQKYVCALCSAGYMARLPGKQQGTALTSNGFNRYILVNNTGPGAPMIRRVERAIYDPNIKETVKFREVAK